MRVLLLVLVAYGSAGPLFAQNADRASTPPSALAPALFDEPPGFTRALEFAGRFLGEKSAADRNEEERKNGFFPELSNMVTGGGWISAGPGYRHYVFGERAVIEASAGLSWRAYKMAQASLETTELAGGRLILGTQLRWQDYTQITYFGRGDAAPTDERSEYRLKATNFVGYGTVRVAPSLSVLGRAGVIGRPALEPPGGTFERGNPFSAFVFPDDPVFGVPEQPVFFHTEASIVSDTRDSHGHATKGGIYRAAWATYSDRDDGRFSFRRYELEGARFQRLGAQSPIVVALRGWFVASDTSDGQMVPFYLAPSLGGNNSIRSYTDYRFHDRHLLLVNAESRVAVFPHLDAVAFVDAGNVAARVRDLNLDKVGYGVGVRLHSDGDTWARFDVGHGREGWHIWFRLNDPFQLSRVNRRTAPIPFAP
jgi:hypothetical protein